MEHEFNPFSQRFAERLVAAHPEWSPLIELDPEGFPPPGSVQVVVPSPVAGRALLIRTYGNQITLDFGADGWHEHFLPQAHSGEAAAVAAALRTIEDLLADRTVIATRYILGRRVWSYAIDAGRVRAPRFGSTRIISWSGTRDATF